jgi:hypothetical protein
MSMNPELQKTLQIFLLAAIVLAAGRTAYILYQRRETAQEEAKPRQETSLNADYYVTPKKLHPFDLKSARQLTAQPVWVRLGYQLTYYPYSAERRQADFAHEAGTLPPLQKLAIQDVVTGVSPLAPGTRQVLARFTLEGKDFAAPIGAEQNGVFRIYSDNIFFIEDPHDLYKHWPAGVWQKIDAHEVQPGMSELQAAFAIGMGIQQGPGDYGSRTLRYLNGGKPLTITFENDRAVAIKPGS